MSGAFLARTLGVGHFEQLCRTAWGSAKAMFHLPSAGYCFSSLLYRFGQDYGISSKVFDSCYVVKFLKYILFIQLLMVEDLNG